VYARLSPEPHVEISPHFPHMLPMAVVRYSSDESAICYVLLSGFVDDVTFHIMERMGQTQRRRLFRPVRQDWWRSGDVCRLRLHLVINCDGFFLAN